MKPEDLMIGDWFRFRYMIDGEETIRTFRITLPKHDLGYVWGDYGTGSRCMCKPEQLEPIPLTPEILEKNGFVFVEGWWEIPRLPNGHGYVAIAFDPDGKGRPTNTIYDLDVSRKESGSADLHLDYVHELQHCLKLFKIDKTIIL